MKQLKSCRDDLRRLFDDAITLRHISEPLLWFESEQLAAEAKLLMGQRDYDVAGIRQQGIVTGYVTRDSLDGGTVGENRRTFASDEMALENMPLLKTFEALRGRRHLFIEVDGHVSKIVTLGDLQKIPVRLWLFGLISLLEMQMLRIIRPHCPTTPNADAWLTLLKQPRIEEALRIYNERQLRNAAIDVCDCLQLCDKATIFRKIPTLPKLGKFESNTSCRRFFRNAQNLRDALAHANDIHYEPWPALADLVKQVEEFLVQIEEFNVAQ